MDTNVLYHDEIMKLTMQQDENGTGLLHKAVYYNHRDIADWLMDKYPESMTVRDNVSTSIVGEFIFYSLNFILERIMKLDTSL